MQFSLKMKKVWGKEYLLALCVCYVHIYIHVTEVSPSPQFECQMCYLSSNGS